MNHYLLKATLNKRALLACFSLILAFTSCERSNGTIGSGKFTEDRPELGRKLTFPVVAYTTDWDSISTKSPSRVVLGNLDDPIFGRVNAGFGTRFLLSKTSPDFAEETVCDSVKLRLAYSGYYGVPGEDFQVQVAPLLEELIDTLPYYSNHQFTVGDLIADTVIALGPQDTVYNGVDSLVGFMAFDLDPSYFQENIFDAAINGETYLADNEDFVAAVPGLYFKDASNGNPAAAYFDLSNAGSAIQMYYHTGEDDTIPKVFTLTFGQNFGDPTGSFNTFSHDFGQAQFDLSMMDTVNGEVLTYVQGGSGARTVLKFPGLDTLIGKNYSINRAELTLDVIQGTASPYLLPQTLLLLQDEDSTLALIRDYSSTVNPTGGGVVRADIREYRYEFNVTRMVHDFVNEKGEILPVFVIPNSSSGNLHRVVLGGGLHPVVPAEFNVYFTRSE